MACMVVHLALRLLLSDTYSRFMSNLIVHALSLITLPKHLAPLFYA
jgi:hypothetical protein